MGRRAAELAGVLVASLITSFVTGLALAAPNEPVLYVVGALVPLALLLAYWLWIEPRAEADRLRAKRLQPGGRRGLRDDSPPDQCIRAARRGSARVLRSAGHLRPVRAGPHRGRIGPGARRTTPARRSRPAWTQKPIRPRPSSPRSDAWEARTANEIEVERGSQDAMSFRHPTGTGPSATSRSDWSTQVLLVEIWVGDERKRAGEQAKDRYR